MIKILLSGWGFVIVVAIIVVIGTIIHYYHDVLARRFVHKPIWLFCQLCRAHRLDLGSCWLLWKVAKAAKLENPVHVFLDPDRFSLNSLGRNWTPDANRLERLRNRLFER